MDTYHKNLEVIARGKGSPQARYHEEECELCNREKCECDGLVMNEDGGRNG